MSKFNTYIKEVNDIAVEAFTEYNNTYTAYKAAESKCNAYPHKNGLGAEYNVKSARYEIDYKEAKAAFENFKRNGFYKYRKRMDEVRNELISSVSDSFAADPTQLDMATLELLKSGILSASEYERLMDKAIKYDNHTMARVIGQHAKEASENAKSNEEAKVFRVVANKGNGMNGNNYIEAFDFVIGLYDRCSRNPAMIGHWDELAGNVIENF